jgi:hypothetical protein
MVLNFGGCAQTSVQFKPNGMLRQFLEQISAANRVNKAREAGAVELDLSYLHFTKFPPELAELTSLRSLKLRCCTDVSADLSPLASFTSLQHLDLDLCVKLCGDLSPLAGLTSLQSLKLSGCKRLSGDLSPLAKLTSLRILDLSFCSQYHDLSPLAGLSSLQTLKLDCCRGFHEFAPLESLLSTLQHLSLCHCPFDDLPSEICRDEELENALGKMRFYYRQQRYRAAETIKSVSPETPPQIFVSYAWGDSSTAASQEDRERQEVIERLCQALENGPWQVVRDKSVLRYGDRISSFMKTLGRADTIIVVLSSKYLRSPYCITELYDIYEQSLREKEGFLRRIIPIVLDDAKITDWRDRVIYTEHWETEFKAMEEHLTHLGGEDINLYKAMRRWHNEVGDMLAYINDVLHPHGFDAIVKDNFAALRHMLEERTRA